MNNIQKNFNNLLTLYGEKSQFLPPKISWKIDLLINLIRGKEPQKQMFSLEQQMQFQDLQNLDNQGLKLVFNSIIQTLFTKTTTQSRKCEIKRKGIFFNWTTATICYDQTNFIISYSNKTCTFKIDQCQIKKSKQSPRTFQLYQLKTHKYSIKFKNEDQMKKILHVWQRQIIQSKNKRNFEMMKTMAVDYSPTELAKFRLFDMSPPKNLTQNKRSFVKQLPSLELSYLQPNTKNNSSMDAKVQRSLPKTSSLSPQASKKSKQKKTPTLKPVPHGYTPKLQNQKLIIALSLGQTAKIYIQYVFGEEAQLKHILSILLLQKSWNSYVTYETIQKSSELPNQIQIGRRYDTVAVIGQLVQINSRVTYTAWGSDMSMITAQSVQSPDQRDCVYSKCAITLQSQQDSLKILIQEQLKSTKYNPTQLKDILFQMYRQITKLQLIQDKIIVKNSQAKSAIYNMFQDQQSTNIQSHEQKQCNYYEKSLEFSYNYDSSDRVEEVRDNNSDQEEEGGRREQRHSQEQVDGLVLRLKSPLDIPNAKYVKLIIANQFEKNYFKFYFPQDILDKYDDYVPWYRIDKMIQNKLYEVIPSRQMRFIDQQLMDSQKQTIRFILRHIGANLISGKSVLNVSLPVDIFQSRTGLQRSAATYGSSPDFLIPRAYSPPLQQMKYVTGFIINEVCAQLVMQKPFNPLLGQTFQGYIKGIPIYYEQISHTPPISSYFMKCPQFTLYGNLISFADLGLNTGVGGNISPIYILFPNGSHFQCYLPPSQIAGFIYGDRKFRCYNRGYILEEKNQLFTEYSLQNQKKGVYETPNKLKVGQLIGGIYKVKPQFFTCIRKFKAQHKNLKKFGGLTKQFILQKYHTISGQWFSEVYIDKQVINEGISLYPIEYAKNVLPSDSNHRLDVTYHKIRDLTNSQKEKEILQIIQRNDRKLREKYQSQRH